MREAQRLIAHYGPSTPISILFCGLDIQSPVRQKIRQKLAGNYFRLFRQVRLNITPIYLAHPGRAQEIGRSHSRAVSKLCLRVARVFAVFPLVYQFSLNTIAKYFIQQYNSCTPERRGSDEPCPYISVSEEHLMSKKGKQIAQ